jgi:hypothetical protein
MGVLPMVDGRFTLSNGILLDAQTGKTWTLVTQFGSVKRPQPLSM